MKKKPAKPLPKVSKADVAALVKSDAILLRLTKEDKETINRSASRLHLTSTEFVTKAALAFAAKVGK